MANSDKNIKITPNISQTAQPNVVFTGQGNVPITLKVLDDSFGTLSFEGSAGQLFSVNNNLSTGVIFSVNDISGIPQIDVNAAGTVRLVPFGGVVGVGTSSPASTSPGVDITADASNSATGQLMIKRASTNDRFRLTCGMHTSNYGFIQAYENSIGGLVLALQPNSGTVGIGTTVPGAKLQIDTTAAATKGLIVKGFTSQSANLQEWQNSAGTVLSNVKSTGEIIAANGLQSYLNGGSTNVVIGNLSGDLSTPTYCVAIGQEAGRKLIQNTVGIGYRAGSSVSGTNYLLNPSNSVYIGYLAQGGVNTGFDNVPVTNEISIGYQAQGKGNNTTVIGNTSTTTSYLYGETSYIGGVAGTAISLQPQPRSTTGAGANVTIAAGAGVTTGAGGSIILQPGAQATSGGDGKFIIRKPGGTPGTHELQISQSGNDVTIVNPANTTTFSSITFQNWITVQNGILSGNYYASGSFNLQTFGGILGHASWGRFTMTNGIGMLAQAGLASHVVFGVRGIASQSANLQEWQDSSGSILSYVDKNGVYVGNLDAANAYATALVATSASIGSQSLVYRPTLELNFADNKSLTATTGPTPTFTRSSPAAYTDASGIIRTAANNVARFNHVFDGTSWVSRGLLIEEQRTNLFTYSEQFNNAAWLKFDSAISADIAAAPDGVTTADKHIPSASNASHGLYNSSAISISSGVKYTVSVYAKASGYNFVFVVGNVNGSSTSGGICVNLIDGSQSNAGASGTYTVVNVGNGWWRISCTVTSSSTNGYTEIYPRSTAGTGTAFTGNGTDGVLIWGAQIELGSFPTSYIPTTSASVIRSADVCQITGSDFTSFWNASEGSFAFEADALNPNSTASGQTVYSFDDGSSANSIYGLRSGNTAGSDYLVLSYTSGVEKVNFSNPAGTWLANVPFKNAIGFKLNDFAQSVNGGAVVTDTNCTMPVGVNQLSIGRLSYAGYPLNGHIARLRYYPTRLPNAVLQDLSSNAPLKIYSSSYHIGLAAPSSLSASTTYTLPSADGSSGQFLTTNSSGTLAWSSTLPGSNVSGTTNYVAKFTGSTVVGNSQMFDNGTNVGIGTASPSDKLHVIGNVRAGNYTGGSGTYLALTGDLPNYASGLYPTLKSDGDIYFAANGYYAAYLAQSSAGNHAFVINDSAANGKVGLGSATTSYFTGGAVAFGATTAAGGGQVYVAPQAATTKGLVVRGFTSQSANLQEWQNSAGTVLASVSSAGNIAGAGISGSTLSGSSYTYGASLLTDYYRVKSFYRAAPTTVGNYIEICNINEGCGVYEIEATAEFGAGIGTSSKKYLVCTSYGVWTGHTLTPTDYMRQPGYTSSFDFELELARIGAYDVRLRLRRTAGTSARYVTITVKQSYLNNSDITSLSGTGTSSLGGFGQGFSIAPGNYALPVIGGSGAGNNIGFYAGNGETSGAGGSIILQPGAQATSGGDGSVRFVNPSNTGQYLTISVSSTQAVFGLTGITDAANNIQIPHNVSLPGKSLASNAATIGSFFISGSTLRATNGTSTQFGSSNGTSTDNINYVWMRQNGHIAWYGDIGLRRDNVGTLTVTNASTGGGSLAFTSSTTNIATATDNLALNGSAFQRLNCTAACNLTGVAPPSGGSHVDGRMIRLYNVGTASLTLAHASASSTSGNRFYSVSGASIVLAPSDYAELIYDSSATAATGGTAGWRLA